MRELKSMCSGEFKKPSLKTKTSQDAQFKDSPSLNSKPSKELKAKLSGDLKMGPKSSSRELSTKSSLRDLLPTRELTSKTSFSTISVASSESCGFPTTPLKAQLILASPRVIVSHPSDGKLWDVSHASGTDSAWEGSSTAGSHDTHTTAGLDPGAPLYDHHAMHPFAELGLSSPSLGISRRYARKRTEAGQKVKRVPVPPIPSELLEEHERQLTVMRNGNGPGRDRLYDSVAVPVAEARPGSDDEQAGPKRSGLLGNARAWFRRI